MYDSLDDELQQMEEREHGAPALVAAVHLDDPISSLDLQPLCVVEPQTTMQEAIASLDRNNVGCLLVREGDRLVGIFTERDIIRRVAGKGLDHEKITVGEHMTPDPDTLQMDDPIAFALNRMVEHGYRHVPIVDDQKRPLGFVSIRDIVNHLATYYKKEIMNLPPRPVRKGDHREGG
ncbi:MAG: CBS domain-containing protein [Fidelibacterota bacterium]|nr:MAG: CBS domain-containing protein [Candidatus Neomarinimicrobiota bacterium]